MRAASSRWAVVSFVVAMLSATEAQTPAPARAGRPERGARHSPVAAHPDGGSRVTSPDGQITFTLLPNAERLTFTVTLENTTVIDPSPIVMELDGYDLSTGVVLERVRAYEGNESYPWYGAQSTATSRYNGATLSLTNDLTSTDYTLEVRAFNDGVAFRHVIPGADGVSRVPDEVSDVHAAGRLDGLVRRHGDGHYEAPYQKKDDRRRSSRASGPARR